MHERLNLCGHETVVDEKIFVDAELGVATFEIACPVTFHAVTQNQILGACGRADRVGLYKSHSVEGTL
jgi:hypothetical protein